jgi:hypothetical protein
MTKTLCFLSIVSFSIFCVSVSSGHESFSIGGYYKNFFSAMDLPTLATLSTGQDQPFTGAVNNRLRLNLSYSPGDWISFDLSYSPTFQVQDPALLANGFQFAFFRPQVYRVFDLNSRLYPSEDSDVRSFGISQNLDRAFVTLSPSFADVYIGRQAISWGSARAVNPTDIIAPFSFDQLDTEERIGVDAVRIRIPTGIMGEVDLGTVFGEDMEFRESAAFLRGRFYAVDTDFFLLLLKFQENLLAGVDIARSIGGAGFWFESVYVFADAFHENEGENYAKATIGIDYSFSGKTYSFVEYHWNQAGGEDPEEYLTRLTAVAYTEGATYLLGKHYLIPGVTYQITPLISLNSQVLINLLDPSAFLSPGLEYNIAQNVYVSIGALVGIGSASPGITFRSEFGEYPEVYYSSFRIYF